MLILTYDRYSGEQAQNAVLLFGTGLVGGEILRALKMRSEVTVQRLSFSWLQPVKWAQEISDALSFFEQRVDTNRLRRVDTVWAAGRAGFSASVAEMDLEMAAFDQVLALATELFARLPNIQHVYHL